MTDNFSKPATRNIFLLYIILLSGITGLLAKHPGHNGDMPFYIACVIEKEQGSSDAVVGKTLHVLQQELSPEAYKNHAERLSNADPTLFEFYRIKPLYILLVFVFHQIGFSYSDATVLPSLTAYFLIGLSIWRFTRQRLDPAKTFLVSLACMLIYPTLVLARLSTPDAISCFILLNAILLIYFGRSKTLWYCLFMLAICARPDNLVAEIIFLFALWRWPIAGFKNKLNTKQLITFSLGLAGIAVLVNLTAAHHFFWFRDAYFSRSPVQYLNDIILYFYVIAGSFFMALLILFIFSGLGRGFSRKREVNYIFYMVCTVLASRFILYPFYEERYVTPFLLFSLLTIAFQYADPQKQAISDPEPGV